MTFISSLQIENVKRVKAVRLEPSSAGLTIIGGRNGQGKTSVLDAIAWALGGEKLAPSNPKRDGAMGDPHIAIELSNGLRVERKGKNGSLSVIDTTGKRGGQALLNSFISTFALDLPRFLSAGSKEKAQTLLKIIGVGDELARLDREEDRLYNERTEIGRIADSKAKHAAELPEYADAPEEPVSVSELIRQQQDILARNGENQRKRGLVAQIEQSLIAQKTAITAKENEILAVKQRLEQLECEHGAMKAQIDRIHGGLVDAQKTAAQLADESTGEIESSLANIESINAQVAANQAKAKAQDEACEFRAQYSAKTESLEKIRSDRMALLSGANLPLPGLSVEKGELLYNGQPWDCMSGSEQLRVAVAIVRRLSPECGFVLMDKLEQMDLQTLHDFGVWLESEGLQVIATRVGNGDECSIVIEDGLPAGETYADVVTGVKPDESPKQDTKERKYQW